MHSFTAKVLSIRVKSLSSDPKHKNFFTFSVVNGASGNELCRFRADNIVQMRRFMASLGSTGGGLFTKNMGEEVPVEATHGKWDVIHPSEDELVTRQMQFDQHEAHVSQVEVTRPEDAPPPMLRQSSSYLQGSTSPRTRGSLSQQKL